MTCVQAGHSNVSNHSGTFGAASFGALPSFYADTGVQLFTVLPFCAAVSFYCFSALIIALKKEKVNRIKKYFCGAENEFFDLSAK